MERSNAINLGNMKTQRIKRRILIPFMKGRPVRDTIITKDDVNNLIILLNTCKTLGEFMNKT